jgi:hypothetical protein
MILIPLFYFLDFRQTFLEDWNETYSKFPECDGIVALKIFINVFFILGFGLSWKIRRLSDKSKFFVNGWVMAML